MAGRGPMSKDPSRRARRNAPRGAGQSRPGPAAQPDLPESLELAEPWWDALGADPRAVAMTAQDWLSALDTAAVLHKFLDSDTKLAAEVRIRKEGLERRLRELAELGLPEAGPAPEDERAETGTESGAPARQGLSSRARRGPLTVVD